MSFFWATGFLTAQTARDFLSCFDEPELPLLGGGRSAVREEGLGLRGLSRASASVIADLQARAPQRVATIDLDATILASSKRAARPCYDGRRGYQPVVAPWAEQDVIVADEFRDGNVSAQTGNRRVIERALAALPEGVDRVYLRADSALYDHSLALRPLSGGVPGSEAGGVCDLGAGELWAGAAHAGA